MIYLYGYRDIKHLTDERLARSLREYERTRPTPQPTLIWPEITLAEADIIELSFGARCETDRIGA